MRQAARHLASVAALPACQSRSSSERGDTTPQCLLKCSSPANQAKSRQPLRLRPDVDSNRACTNVRRIILVTLKYRESSLVRVTSRAHRCRNKTSRGKLVPTISSNLRHAGLVVPHRGVLKTATATDTRTKKPRSVLPERGHFRQRELTPAWLKTRDISAPPAKKF